MKYFNLMNISLAQIMMFLTAANLENFSKAALQLNLTQPTVSKGISTLENELGIQLFERSRSHKVKLTESGFIFHQYCQGMIADLSQAISDAQRKADGSPICLNVGANKDACNEAHLLDISKRFDQEVAKGQNRSLDFSVDLMSCEELIQRIRSRKLDAAIICSREITDRDRDSFHVEPLISSSFVAFIHASNPLYNRDSVTLADVAYQPLILLQPYNTSNTHATNMVHMLASHGYNARVGIYANNSESMVFSLCLGQGIILADEFFRIPDHTDIKAFRIHEAEMGSECNGLSVIYAKDNDSPFLRDFVRICKDYFQNDYVCPFPLYG